MKLGTVGSREEEQQPQQQRRRQQQESWEPELQSSLVPVLVEQQQLDEEHVVKASTGSTVCLARTCLRHTILFESTSFDRQVGAGSCLLRPAPCHADACDG
jgi:hypothetical protein